MLLAGGLWSSAASRLSVMQIRPAVRRTPAEPADWPTQGERTGHTMFHEVTPGHTLTSHGVADSGSSKIPSKSLRLSYEYQFRVKHTRTLHSHCPLVMSAQSR